MNQMRRTLDCEWAPKHVSMQCLVVARYHLVPLFWVSDFLYFECFCFLHPLEHPGVEGCVRGVGVYTLGAVKGVLTSKVDGVHWVGL